MAEILFVEPERELAESVAEHIKAHLDVSSEIVDSLEAARKSFESNKGCYLAIILSLEASPENYAPFEKIPTIVITGSLPISPKKIAFASNVLDYVPDYDGYNLEYIVQLLKRGLFAESYKMLIVEDEPVSLSLMRKLLSNKGYSVLEAGSGEQALARLEKDPDIRMMIIDGDICEKNRFDFIRRIRKDWKKNQLSIIALCERQNEYQRVTLLRNGASDCIDKPFKIEDFHVRVMNNLQLVEVLNELTENSNRDFLTRLYNRRHFFEIGNKLYENFKRGAIQLTLAMIDIDNLKVINDTKGHLTGDKAIKKTAEVLTANLRTADVIARLGGEEFCVLCTDVRAGEAFKVFERIRQSIAEHSVQLEQGVLNFTISTGVTSRMRSSFEEMIHAADMLLYRAKENGRNIVVAD